MSSYGHSSRSRPALYKPTDFGSHQNRSSSTSSEPKEEEKVIRKIIQQRPFENKSKPSEKNISTDSETVSTKVKNTNKGKMSAASSSSKKSDKPKEVSTAKPGGIAAKDLDKIQKLKDFMAKQQLDDSPSKREAPKPTKEHERDSKENKDVKESKDTRGHKQNFNRNNQRGGGNRPSSGKNKPANQSDKTPHNKMNKPPSRSSGNQASGNQPKNSTSTGDSSNTRIKSAPSKGQSTNQKNSMESYRNRNRTQEHTAQHDINSYYSQQPNYTSGVPSSGDMSWLQMQYAMGGTPSSHSGILGNPYGQHLGYSHLQSDAGGSLSQQKDAAKLSTAQTSRDRSERQKSLDFVKSFFDNDPEVQYNRKQNSEKRPEKAPAVASTILPNESHVPMHHAGNLPGLMHHSIPTAASVGHGHSNVYHHSTLSPGPLHLSGSPGALHPGGSPGPLHSVGYPSSMPPVNQQSTIQQVGHQSSCNPVSHQSSFNSVSYQSSLLSMNPQQTYNQVNHQSSMQHNYPEMFSQVNPAGMLSPGSNIHSMHQHHSGTMVSSTMGGSMGGTSGYSTYSNYFPSSGHQSHIQHVQQQIHPSVVADILQDQATKPKKWQQAALSKCGPIDSSQAQSLIEQLIDNSYECMVCCDSVKWNNPVWSCSNCFHIFHLFCIKKWAKSETAAVKDESGWRCPGCQNVSTRPPNKYFCFCGKVRDPDWNPRDGITPHSCGEVCKKKRINPPCSHSCNELCHPGPCPSCPVMVSKHCPCGKMITKVRCGQTAAIKCENICMKLMKCGEHYCQKKCHEGPCETCDMKHNEACYCGKESRVVMCGTGNIVTDVEPGANEKSPKRYSCKKLCDRALCCKNHQCESICHAGECNDCPFLPDKLQFCPCGKIPVTTLLPAGMTRTSCLDDIPTCESFCGKKLNCGPKGSSHLCMMKCHTGKCKPCEKIVEIQCRCGATKKEACCKDLVPGEPILCERKCSKKRKCGRHKCNQKCCMDRDHTCNIICGKKLSCGMHKCEEVCHTGFCPPCWRAGFDELACMCGSTVLYPPIACGTKPPNCDQPCTRPHSCVHQPLHTCHSDDACPPCTVLVTKQCMGNHEMWKNVPCHLTDVSCGRACGKVSQCGYHKCIKTCHKGPCLELQEVCTQPCPVERRDCSHPCSAPCHVGMDCPSTPCKSQITISCRCGRKSANAVCLAGNVNSAYQSFNAELLGGQLRNLQAGQSIDISSLTNTEKRPKFLECDEECSRLERNKRLAEALGIDNTEGGHFQHAIFSLFLKEEAKIQYPFIQMLEAVLYNLILIAKKSSQTQIHHAFPPMSGNQRKIIHELAEVYGCKSFSQDKELKRSTVVVATKDSYIPNIKLSVLTEREIMRANPPQPVMITRDDNAMVMGPTTPLKLILKQPASQAVAAATQKVDYFDDNYVE